MVLLEGTASRYPLLTLLQVGMHSSRDIYLAIGILICLAVGLWVENQMVILFLT